MLFTWVRHRLSTWPVSSLYHRLRVPAQCTAVYACAVLLSFWSPWQVVQFQRGCPGNLLWLCSDETKTSLPNDTRTVEKFHFLMRVPSYSFKKKTEDSYLNFCQPSLAQWAISNIINDVCQFCWLFLISHVLHRFFIHQFCTVIVSVQSEKTKSTGSSAFHLSDIWGSWSKDWNRCHTSTQALQEEKS